MPKDHSASPLSCGLLKSAKVFVSSFVQTCSGSWRDMVVPPSIPMVVPLQDAGIALSRQLAFCQQLTMVLRKNPIPESVDQSDELGSEVSVVHRTFHEGAGPASD